MNKLFNERAVFIPASSLTPYLITSAPPLQRFPTLLCTQSPTSHADLDTEKRATSLDIYVCVSMCTEQRVFSLHPEHQSTSVGWGF